MSYHKVTIAGINTSELTVLTESQKIALLRDYQQTHDKKIRDTLIKGNLRLVLSIVQRFAGRGEDVDDLLRPDDLRRAAPAPAGLSPYQGQPFAA